MGTGHKLKKKTICTGEGKEILKFEGVGGRNKTM